MWKISSEVVQLMEKAENLSDIKARTAILLPHAETIADEYMPMAEPWIAVSY